MSKRQDSNRGIVKEQLLQKCGKRCMLCGRRVVKAKLTLHHIIKWCDSHETTEENSALLDEKCHRKLHGFELKDKQKYDEINAQIRSNKVKYRKT